MPTLTSFLTDITSVVTAVIGWVGDILTLFLQPPMILFIGFAAVSAAYGMTRRLVPAKKR